ncbi:MAG TPA: CpsB/CapC family capsule biosynthesis tyrosine phosphatase [Geobacteraceae bacterium]
MTDWHCHILPGIDDGPATMDESVEMARMLQRAGYTAVHCTPHLIRGCYQATNAQVLHALQQLQERLDREGIGIVLLPGREYCVDEFLLDHLREPLPLGDTKFLLIEIPSRTPVEFVKETLYRVTCGGYVPMIAHPERCRLLDLPASAGDGLQKLFDVRRSMFDVFKNALNRSPRMSNPEPRTSNGLLAYLQEIGCKFQGNLGSFAGRYGERVRQAAERLREAGVYTHFGSDAHGAEHVIGSGANEKKGVLDAH